MKLKIDTKSIKFKSWLYFILFAAVLMAALWIVQVLLLNNLYGTMKTSQTEKVARNIEASFQSNDQEDFFDDVSDFSASHDMYIYIVSYDGKTTYFSPASGDYDMTEQAELEEDSSDKKPDDPKGPSIGPQYISQMQSLNEEMIKKGGIASMTFGSDDNSQKVLACGTVLHAEDKEDMIVYIFSPLYPVSSTISILARQLVIVTLISLILACVISFYLSNRITRPIRKINNSAKRLAAGEYGIVFTGGHYTEINDLADTLTGASIELEKSDLMQKDLIANVSHDLRTPLTMIKSYAEMIRDISGDDPVKREQHLNVIIDETDRLNSLVGDLLTVSKIQSGKNTLEKARFSLSEAVGAIVETYRVKELDGGYTINLKCPADFNVFADEEKIKQVVSNLISNAVKFCGDDKTVDVVLKKQGRQVKVSVIDHGCGIAPEDLEHIWERYYRASSNMVRSVEGSGLGLSICKEILSLHKSDFGVDSTLGKGSTFWFKLDLVK
ncbi:MAG: HAMP domain-containing protein [Clostridiales bacterium]|nr:HAMP domain-containing protein [Clostridiales bacterium]